METSNAFRELCELVPRKYDKLKGRVYWQSKLCQHNRNPEKMTEQL
jgi:hypothetical protein